jgi:hypothetical protein
VIGSEGEILHRDGLFDAVIGAVQPTLVKTGEKEDGLTEGFTRNRACVRANASYDQFALDDAYFFPELGSLDSGFLARWTSADDEQVVMGHASPH